MISRQVYANSFSLFDMLHNLQYDPSFPVRGAIARIIYWDYSFNFEFVRDYDFTRNALNFISLGGVALLIRNACGTIYPLRSPGHPHESEYFLNGRLERDFRVCVGDQGCYASSYQRVFTLSDVEFQLPPFALRYDTAALQDTRVEITSLRKLAIEILSEMSNYNVYRAEIGRLNGAICKLLATLKTFIRHFLESTRVDISQRSALNVSNNSTVFIVERLMNLLANMAFDGGAKMSPGRDRFNTDASTTKMGTCNMSQMPDCFEATDNLACFILNEVGDDLLAFGDAVQCASCLRNVSRLFCNTLGYANQRIFFRLSMMDVGHSLRKWIDVMKEIKVTLSSENNNGEEAALEVEKLVIGLRAADRACHWVYDGMAELWRTNQLFINE